MRRFIPNMEKLTPVTVLCPACQMNISPHARRCPHCREDLRNFAERHPILTTIGLFFAIIFGLSILLGNVPATEVDTPKKEDFATSLRFTGTGFMIENIDEYDCQNSRMIVNDEYVFAGYLLEKQSTYTIRAEHFVKSNGERLNPFEIKPMTFSITCRGNNELQNAFWYGEF